MDSARPTNIPRGGVLVGRASGAAAYIVHLSRIDKIVISSAVTFVDIPSTTPFLSQRPDHWESPATGVDDDTWMSKKSLGFL